MYDDRYDKSTFEEVVNAARRDDVAAIYELGSRYRLGVDGAERNGIVKKCAVGEYPKSWIGRYQAA